MIGELTWYVSRAAGLVSWVLLAVAVLWGLLLTSRLLDRRPSAAWLLDLHRHLGGLALLLTAIHVAAIWLDDFVDYTFAEILVPFTSDLERTPVALGTIAFWLLVTVQLTGGQRHRIPTRIWRRLHWLSLPLFVVAGIHGWLVGTDITHPVVVIVALVLLTEVTLVSALRLRYRPRVARSDGDERQCADRQADAQQLRA